MQSNISQFLERFQVALLGEDSFKEDVCNIVLSETKFPIDKNCISETNGNIIIKTDSYMKTEIMLHKENILTAIRGKYKNKLIKDIV